MNMTLIYIVLAVACWPLIAGILFSAFQGDSVLGYAATHSRGDAGLAIAIGAVCAFFWPIGLPIAWLLTGFAEHGIWRRGR